MKEFRILLAIVFIALLFINTCYGAVGLGTNVDNGSGNNKMTTATAAVGRIWGSVKLVLQVVSLSIVVACGVRYMFASADQKADIKKSLGILVLGCAIVFGTTLIIDFIKAIAGDLFGSGISNEFNGLS